MLKRRRGFSITELLIVIGVIAVLIGILIPVISKARESAKRVSCASNLRQMGAALVAYGQANAALPQLTFAYNSSQSGVNGGKPTAFTCFNGDDPFGGTGVSQSNAGTNTTRPCNMDVTAALFLLVRLNYIKTTSTFICPSSEGVADTLGGELPTKRSNFTDRTNLTYSIALPYPTMDPDNGDIQYGYYYGPEMRGGLPLMSDINPGDWSTPKLTDLTLASPESDMRKGNSPNHGRKGQNVLYFDGRVEFVDTPFAGVERDNIFTKQVVGGTSNQASDTTATWNRPPPRSSSDSQMVPTAISTGISAY